MIKTFQIPISLCPPSPPFLLLSILDFSIQRKTLFVFLQIICVNILTSSYTVWPKKIFISRIDFRFRYDVLKECSEYSLQINAFAVRFCKPMHILHCESVYMNTFFVSASTFKSK